MVPMWGIVEAIGMAAEETIGCHIHHRECDCRSDGEYTVTELEEEMNVSPGSSEAGVVECLQAQEIELSGGTSGLHQVCSQTHPWSRGGD